MSILSDKRRLVQEFSAVRERWGERARWCCDSSRTQYWWEYEIPGLNGNRLPVRVSYPGNYPAKPPIVKAMSELPGGTPHLLMGNVLCLYYPGQNKNHRDNWDPALDTAAVAIGDAHRWFLAFQVWLTTGEWAVPDAVAS